MPLKLGRRPRSHDPRVPHMSSLTAGRKLTPPPASVSWTTRLPKNLGMMLNDLLGDCTCAAYYHARQVWSVNTGAHIDTATNKDVEKLYENACGYDPSQTQPDGSNPTDQGGNEQDVLTYLQTVGATDGSLTDKLVAFVEIDPRNHDDIKRAIADCGLVYIGFNVPAFLMPPDAPPPKVWDVAPDGDQTIIGGHAVIMPAYTSSNLSAISWGSIYAMTWNFWDQFVEEAYALADNEWIASTGKTPGGLTLAQLEQQMSAF